MTSDLLMIPSGVLSQMVATVEGVRQELQRRAYARVTERLRPALERVPGSFGNPAGNNPG